MPKKGGKKGGRFTVKQDRQAEHIAEGYQKKGVSKKEAMSRGYATVNAGKKKGKKKR